MSFTNDEVNYLIYLYLRESGFEHSAFMFGFESGVVESKLMSCNVPAAALLSIIQKGILFQQVELSVERANSGCNGLEPDGRNMALFDLVSALESMRQRNEKPKDTPEQPRPAREPELTEPANKKRLIESPNTAKLSSRTQADIPTRRVTMLRGHESEVFICAWNPTQDLLASGSGDSSARIWNLVDLPEPTQLVLRHSAKRGEAAQTNKDVTSLDWNSMGSLLATGSYDGYARVWSTCGSLEHILMQHKGPIFALKWNKSGTYLVSAGVDSSTIVWDVENAKCEQQFFFHSAPALDVDWQNDQIFASCSTDERIYICQVGSNEPLRKLEGHRGEVNAVRWSPDGSLLASCSDDHTLKVWSLSCANSLLHDFNLHRKEIYTIRWSPTGPGTCYGSAPLWLASASFDTTARLWEVEQKGTCVHTLSAHTQPVYSVAFSPDGKMLATGSFDKYVRIWDVHNGKLISSYCAGGGIFEVCWNYRGDKVGASAADGTVCVLEIAAIR